MRRSALLFLVTSASVFRFGEGIDCYQCNSNDLVDPFQCQEMFPDDSDIVPRSCDEVYNAAYCIKHVGRFEGGVGTRRFCSSVDMGNYCDYIKQPGDKLEYRSCVYTCSSDGCNPANTIAPSSLGLAAINMMTVLLYFTTR